MSDTRRRLVIMDHIAIRWLFFTMIRRRNRPNDHLATATAHQLVSEIMSSTTAMGKKKGQKKKDTVGY